jgi:hypothetical protein
MMLRSQLQKRTLGSPTVSSVLSGYDPKYARLKSQASREGFSLRLKLSNCRSDVADFNLVLIYTVGLHYLGGPQQENRRLHTRHRRAPWKLL